MEIWWNDDMEDAIDYIKKQWNSLHTFNTPNAPDHDKNTANIEQHELDIGSRLPTVIPSDINQSDEEHVPDDNDYPKHLIKDKCHQRPRGRNGHLRLWEFLLSLLKNPNYNSTHIQWLDRQNGVFRIVRNSEIAKMWGEIKNNKNMTYQNMSRAMRYYYKFKILDPVLGRRLVYKFGSNSYGWQQANEG